jgi:hypothetical protein
MGALARHPHGTVPDESDRSSSQSQGLEGTVPSSGCRIHHHGAGCTTRNSPIRGDGLCFRLMVFVVAPPKKTRDRAIVGDNAIQHQQEADLRLAVLPLLQWLAGAIQSRPQQTFVPASPADTRAASGSRGGASLQELNSKIDALRAELAEVKQLLTAERGEVIKEAYTVEEVAKRTGLSEYTIREEGCNKGRIEGAYKGRDRKWRIPHAALMDLLTNGLPPK